MLAQVPLLRRKTMNPSRYNGINGSAWGPVILPVFKTGGRHLRDVVGVFDSHTLPPS